jgi:hypothetical protein
MEYRDREDVLRWFVNVVINFVLYVIRYGEKKDIIKVVFNSLGNLEICLAEYSLIYLTGWFRNDIYDLCDLNYKLSY